MDALGGGENPCMQFVLPHVLVSQVLKQLYDSATAGHLGVQITVDKIQIHFKWVGQHQDVEDWCHRCEACAARKPSVPSRVAPVQPSASGAPFQRIAMDIVGPFPQTDKGNAYILVIGDYFTKWVDVYPMKDMEAASVAVCLHDFICRYGAPDFLHTDQGKSFESTLVSDLCKSLGIVKTRTTPYHPQSDKMIERINCTLLGMLSSGILEKERNWEQILPAVMMAYRTSVHKTMHMSPFGQEVCLPVDVMFGNPPAELDKCSSAHALYRRNTLESAYHKVREYLTVESRIQKEGYDRTVSPAYKAGELVQLHCPVNRGKVPL